MSAQDPDPVAIVMAEAADRESDPQVRLAALDAATRCPLRGFGWTALSGLAHRAVTEHPPGSPERRFALALAARLPLCSVRDGLRSIAEDASDPDATEVAIAIAGTGDRAPFEPLAAAAAAGRTDAFVALASMPLEDFGIDARDIPQAGDPDARLWRAIGLARLGEWAPLDGFLDGSEEIPTLFWGDPWTSYERLAAVRPIPGPFHQRLLGLLPALDQQPDHEIARMARLLVRALTGVADAEGDPLPQPREAPRPVPAAPLRGPDRSLAVAQRLPDALFDPDARDGLELQALSGLPVQRVAPLLVSLLAEAGRQPPAAPGSFPGNGLIDAIARLPVVDDWPVGQVLSLYLDAAQSMLDDGQLAWIAARAAAPRIATALRSALAQPLSAEQRHRLFDFMALVGDHRTGRGASPWRGAGGGVGHAFREPPIDDRPLEGAAPPVPEPAGVHRGRPDAEERRVHAAIRAAGRQRGTFAAGEQNTIRCWIGLPEPERAEHADQPLPEVDIPEHGLALEVVLVWNDQSDRGSLVLPPDRTARTADCDLHLNVPSDELFVSAEIAFMYRGRTFEVVRVEGPVIPADEAQSPRDKVRVRVQASRRGVIRLVDRETFDATVIVGGESGPDVPGTTAAPAALRVFGAGRPGAYNLVDAKAAITWLNERVFGVERSLVRRRAQADAGAGEPALDADDPEAVYILRTLARHGSSLYQHLATQGFVDPGDRIQVLNLDPGEYVPLEFVYDRGYPADDAVLCPGWREGLESDAAACPACGTQAGRAGPAPDSVDVICPLGFWSLRKILERVDVDPREAMPPGDGCGFPRDTRRTLPAIDNVVFGSSWRVPEAERQAVWETLRGLFRHPARVQTWSEWRAALQGQSVQLLLALPHHDVEDFLDFLQIGDEAGPTRETRLSRGQLSADYTNPRRRDPGPIVLLLGCRTGASGESGYVQLTRRFKDLDTAIVVGTLAKVLGRHAAPVAREFLTQLAAIDDATASFGAIMRRVRRRMLARGYLMALCLVALGDADWHLSPRSGP